MPNFAAYEARIASPSGVSSVVLVESDVQTLGPLQLEDFKSEIIQHHAEPQQLPLDMARPLVAAPEWPQKGEAECRRPKYKGEL